MLAPGAGAEGQILGLDLDQVLLACPGAMQQPIMAHLEKKSAPSGTNVVVEQKVE